VSSLAFVPTTRQAFRSLAPKRLLTPRHIGEAQSSVPAKWRYYAALSAPWGPFQASSCSDSMGFVLESDFFPFSLCKELELNG
jgi:hypothetical protein